MDSVSELKQCLVDVWHSLQHDVIDAARGLQRVRKQLRVCIHADEQHFEHFEHACHEIENVMDKLTLFILKKTFPLLLSV